MASLDVVGIPSPSHDHLQPLASLESPKGGRLPIQYRSRTARLLRRRGSSTPLMQRYSGPVPFHSRPLITFSTTGKPGILFQLPTAFKRLLNSGFGNQCHAMRCGPGRLSDSLQIPFNTRGLVYKDATFSRLQRRLASICPPDSPSILCRGTFLGEPEPPNPSASAPALDGRSKRVFQIVVPQIVIQIMNPSSRLPIGSFSENKLLVSGLSANPSRSVSAMRDMQGLLPAILPHQEFANQNA